MATFGERLRFLRERKGESQIELGRLFDVTNATISAYETGIREAPPAMLRRLADHFDVSIDYLLGRTDDPTPPGAKPRPVQPTDEEFHAFLRGRGLSEEDIELVRMLEERRHRERLAREAKGKGQE